VIAIRGAGNRFELVGDYIAAPPCSFLYPSFLADSYPPTLFEIADYCTCFVGNRLR